MSICNVSQCAKDLIIRIVMQCLVAWDVAAAGMLLVAWPTSGVPGLNAKLLLKIGADGVPVVLPSGMNVILLTSAANPASASTYRSSSFFDAILEATRTEDHHDTPIPTKSSTRDDSTVASSPAFDPVASHVHVARPPR